MKHGDVFCIQTGMDSDTEDEQRFVKAHVAYISKL